jgi:hypothetical protein
MWGVVMKEFCYAMNQGPSLSGAKSGNKNGNFPTAVA